MLLETRAESPLPTPEHAQEERLLVEAAQADPRRFAALYDLHFERVYAYVARRVANRAEAEDVTADVFQRALASLPRFEWRGAPFVAWLYRIAANAIRDRWQRTAREKGNPSAGEPSVPADPGIEEIEQRARLFRMVATLPEDQQRVLVMRFAEEKSLREIAAAIGRSEGAVKQLQFRALENLRARMSESNA